LVKGGVVSRGVIERVVDKRQARVGEDLRRLGLVTEEDVSRALARQRRVPYIDLGKTPSDSAASTVVPPDVGSELGILGLTLDSNKTLDVVVADPTDPRVAEALRRLPVTRVRVAMTPPSQLRPRLAATYGQWVPASPPATVVLSPGDAREAWAQLGSLVPAAGPVLRTTTRHGVEQSVVEEERRTRPLTEEPRRDWEWGALTGHRLRTAVVLVSLMVSLYLLQDLMWPRGRNPHDTGEHVYALCSLVWLSALIPSVLGLVGMLWYRHARDLDAVKPIPQLVSFRMVTRGTNRDAVLSTIRRCRSEMDRSPLFRYVIEVVSEHPGVASGERDVVAIIIPPDYHTANGTLYKARGLQYALERSRLPDDAWLVHLDEETQPTPSGIKGIARMITEEEQSGRLRIGQGAILYHRDWNRHPLLTLADNVRTGDDFARFHFQHRVGITLFGLHGSYIVCRNDVEKSVGFDFGPVGSITEDAFWALRCMEEGRRVRWVDGYLEEQSTHSVSDFLKQRRRWFQGLVKVSLHAPVRRRYRAMLGFNTFSWAFAPLGLIYTLLHLFWGYRVNPAIRFGANFSFASFSTLYLVGLRANLDESGKRRRLTRLGWNAAQILLLPVFSALESLGVAYAVVRPHAGFHVVKK
jgi:egghead protein (zeste-white 4 protein)